MTAKQKREMKLLEELQTKHGYMVLQEKRKAERFTTQWRRRKQTLVHTPAIAMRLAVPDDSALGEAMKAIYLAKPARR